MKISDKEVQQLLAGLGNSEVASALAAAFWERGRRIVELENQLEAATPSPETREKLMQICQDQGELKLGKRVDHVVESHADLARDIRKLHSEAADYRVKIGDLETRNPDVVVDESMVPAWVSEKIGKTNWKIIARKKNGRNLIGMYMHFVHLRSDRDFEDKDHCWEEALSNAFYWAQDGLPLPSRVERVLKAARAFSDTFGAAGPGPLFPAYQRNLVTSIRELDKP